MSEFNDHGSETIYGWVRKQFSEGYIHDIVKNGADHGFPGITYSDDIDALYARYHWDFWAYYVMSVEDGLIDKRYFMDNVWTHQHFTAKLVFNGVWRVCCDLVDSGAVLC